MKKVFTLVTLMIFTLSSCSDDGTQGPPGPQGPPGEPGEDGYGIVFDLMGDFTQENDYTLYLEYEEYTSEQVFESDVVLVYLRTGEAGEADGEPVYVWRLLPQTYYVDNGTVQYNYDYSFYDTTIFLESDLNLGTLGTEFLDEQVFRVAIIPATFASNPNMDVSNFYDVMSVLEIQEKEIPQMELQQ